MKTIKNYETHITVPKHVTVEKQKDNLIFKGPLGITLINLALYDKNGYSQLNLLLKNESNIIFFKSCDRAFFKCMLKIIKDKMHVVLNGFLLAMHVRGVGYRVEIQNNEFNTEQHNNKLLNDDLIETPLNPNRVFSPLQRKSVVFKKSHANITPCNKEIHSTGRQTLFFKIGFSHDFKYICPSSVRIFTKQQTLICIYGIDRNQVSTIAAKIRLIKKPSVYKGKGLIFLNEKITLKQGKRK